MKSLNNETVLISQERLRLKAGVSNRTTARNSIKRLEELGLITAYRNGYKIHCDEFVTLIKITKFCQNPRNVNLCAILNMMVFRLFKNAQFQLSLCVEPNL